jgi:integrase
VVTLRPKSGARKAAERQKLTDAIVKRLKPPAISNRITYDGDVSGFGVRITAGDSRSYILNYRVRGTGRERRITIGEVGDWRTADARAQAKEYKKLVDNGGDPLAAIEAERKAPTVADLIDRFEAEHLPRKRASTAADYKRMLDKHVRPFFGNHVKVADVTFEDCERLHRRISAAGHSYRANAVLRVLSKMFTLACHWKTEGSNTPWRTSNPCKGIERNTEYQRKRYLKSDELERLTKALREYPNQQAANIIRILLMTGARRGEVLAMRWADLDLSEGKWGKKASSTKQKEDHEVPLAAPVRQLLSEIRQKQRGGAYVFRGNGDSGHVVAIKKAWARILKNAGIAGLRIHDLRHSFASQLVSGGASLPLIGALLGHSNPVTTHRYAHLFDDPQRAAVEKVGAVYAAAGQPAAAPILLKRRTKRRG